ncbi:MAG: helix-turn-helix transcriptional regulator [Tepidisphaeraceae bacterium]
MVASMFTAAHDALVAAVVQLRKSAGLTQRQLAEALGREQNLIGRIETGQRRIDLIEWIGICRACKVDPEVEIAKLVRQIKPLVPQRRR